MSRKRIAVTFDVDMVDYVGHHSNMDEIEECFPAIQNILLDYPQVNTTWFIRVDSQIETLHGHSDFILHRHADVLDWLRSYGHQIGWHHHAYRFHDDAWLQEARPGVVTGEIRRFGELARKLGMSTVRMGWGWHTNESMQVLDELGFGIDSSSIPRPCYPWESGARDWSRSPSQPYRPSQADYQLPGEPSLKLLEIPMSTTHIPAPNDNLAVQRYVNLAYRPDVFDRAVSSLGNRDLLVTITHPYELLENATSHPLIAFDSKALRSNLARLAGLDAEFVTLEEVARCHARG